ncbi:MAG TPA: cytochrome c [Thermoanaerobaculia bacterium]|nr:cytochrome c [Thermoanaerobaculia bacterium]
MMPRQALGLACLLLAGAGCRDNMHTQNKVKPLEESRFFRDGSTARPLPANTVARGDLRADPGYYTGVREQRALAEIPMPVTHELLRRGQERFNIFCSPCHGRLGDGHGMIVGRGYKQPNSYHDERLRNSPVGYFFNVMSEGFGVMPSYASQIPVEDRWAIAAYVRVLQYSQSARLAELPEAQRKAVEAELAGQPNSPSGPAGPSAPPSEVP